MASDIFKSAAWKRFEKSGLGLQALHKKTRLLWTAHRIYFDDKPNWVKKFHALNNSIMEVMKHPGINPIETERRNELIFKLADIEKEHIEDVEKLVTEHPALFDEIWAAGKVFEEIGLFLKEHYKNMEVCIPQIVKAECELEKVTALHDKMEKRLNQLKLDLKEQQAIYRKIVD